MQFFQQTFYENMQKSQADYMEEVWKEQEKLAKEIQDIRRGQMTQVAANTQRFEAEKNLQLALERQGREIAEIRRQVNLWNNNVSSKEAYACWAQQQANPNLSEVSYHSNSEYHANQCREGKTLVPWVPQVRLWRILLLLS
ncbi:hypothetical protein PIB30_104062 [Stylosanthes scabra]|uniref:Uncharacterized protein n=1 Tax=Stylosanthes scabra TaxID=79078 RepID=A0ABU6ZX78_9FABA|nr:hypothetical protein [Stylosanthes scabra]